MQFLRTARLARVPRLLAGLAFLIIAAPAPAEPAGSNPASPVVIERVQVGINGVHKPGEWTMLRAVVRAAEPAEATLIVTAPDADENPVSFASPVITLQANVPETVETRFRLGRVAGDLQVELRGSAAGVQTILASRRLRPQFDAGAELPVPLRLDVPVWAALARLPAATAAGAEVADLAAWSAASAEGAAPRLVNLESWADLPLDSVAWQSIDVLFLSTRGLEASTLRTPRGQALRQWIEGGGHLIVFVSSTEAYAQSLLAEWSNVSAEGTTTVRQFINLETYAGQNAPFRFAGALPIARFGQVPARNVLVRDAGTPVAVSVACGFGRISLLALDVEQPPAATWKGLPALLRKLAGQPVHRRQQQSAPSNKQLTHLGVTDLATQWLAAGEEFPAVNRPSHWWVMGMILAYMLLVGPLDFYLVHRRWQRPAWTWLTLPLVVLVAVGVAAFGARGANSLSLQVNQVSLIDVDAASRSVRGRAWVTLYSPVHARYDVTLQPSRSLTHARSSSAGSPPVPALGWASPPERAVGGLYRTGGTGLSAASYQCAIAGDTVERVPVQQWSTKSLCASWRDTAADALVDSRLQTAGIGQVSGTIAHHLPGPLEDCLLVVGGWAYMPVDQRGQRVALAPNAVWQPAGPNGRLRDLKALLTGEKKLKLARGKLDAEIMTSYETYNPLDHDDANLVPMVTFHSVAGGRDYTGLTHAALRDLELSALLPLGRGILLGRVESPGADVLIDGKAVPPTRRSTWVRMVVPVEQVERVVPDMLPKVK